MKTSNLIDRSNSCLIWSIACMVVMVVPQTPNIIKLTLAIPMIALMSKSGSLLDKAKDNPQRKIFEEAMLKKK